MCLTSDAVYRIRDADAIFRIERKDDQKIAQNSQLFYRKYFEITSNTSGRVRGTLWRIVSKYILFFCAWFSRFTVGTWRTRRITLRAPRKITTDHDMRPIRLNTRPFRLYYNCLQKFPQNFKIDCPVDIILLYDSPNVFHCLSS